MLPERELLSGRSPAGKDSGIPLQKEKQRGHVQTGRASEDGPVCGQSPGEAGSQTIRYLRHLEEFREAGDQPGASAEGLLCRAPAQSGGTAEYSRRRGRHCGAVYGCKVQVTAGSVRKPV